MAESIAGGPMGSRQCYYIFVCWLFFFELLSLAGCKDEIILYDHDQESILYHFSVKAMQKKDPVEALKWLKKSMKVREYKLRHNMPTSLPRSNILIQMGLIALEEGQYLKAKKCIEQALAINDNGDRADAYYGLGRVYLEEIQNYRQAGQYFQKTLEINPNHRESLFYQGIVLFNLRQFRPALAKIDEAISLGREESSSYYWRGLMQQYLADLEGARADYLQSIDLTPNCEAALEGLISVFYKLGDSEQGLRYQRILLKLHPWSRFHYLRLAILYLRHGEYQFGLQQFMFIWIFVSMMFVSLYVFLVSFSHLKRRIPYPDIFHAERGVIILIILWFLILNLSEGYLIYNQLESRLNPFENSMIVLQLDYVVFPLLMIFSLIYMIKKGIPLLPNPTPAHLNLSFFWGLKGLLYSILFALLFGAILLPKILDFLNIHLRIAESVYTPFLASAQGYKEYLLAIFSAGLLAPLAEELFFRGIIYNRIRQWYGLWQGIVFTAIFFAVFHITMGGLPSLVLFGMILCYTYHKTESLLAPFLVHSFYNLLLLGWVIMTTPKF
jgi:membrane protease YdiL (CAAX protease family)/Tfp pilus assembly protein PilF